MAAITLLSRRSTSTVLRHFRFTLNRFKTDTNTSTWKKFGDISGPLDSWPNYKNDLGPPFDLGGNKIDSGEIFPGCDYKHWLIIMNDFNEERVSKEEMINLSVRTLAKVLGSEDEARKKIYNIFTDRYFGFGCEIDEETSNKLEDLPDVMFAVPDCYVDAENKDYGAELVVNGKVVQRTLERQRRVEPVYP